MNAVAAYVYAGGFSLGVKKYFTVRAHLEDEKPYGEKIINLNRKNYWGQMPVIPFGTLDNSCVLPDSPNENGWPSIKADLLFSNPPCAPFSNINPKSHKGGWRTDSRLQCWENVVNYGIENEFPFVAIETVPPAYSKAEEFLVDKIERFNNKGYQVIIFLHNAMFMGSCQNRPRLLFLASKYDIYFEPYYSKPIVTVNDQLNKVEVLDADDYTPYPTIESQVPLLTKTRPGERCRAAWNRLNPPETRILNHLGHVKGRPPYGVRRLKKDEQCGTLVGYCQVHPVHNRFISVAEFKVLTDFPPDYIFLKSKESFNLMARGVSSKVGEWLAQTVGKTLTKKRKPKKLSIIHNGLQGWNDHEEYYTEEYVGFPNLSLRSKL